MAAGFWGGFWAGFCARVFLKDLSLACPASLKGSGILLKVLGSVLGGFWAVLGCVGCA